MSLRVCYNCDYVIDNRITKGDCPKCGGSRMISPLDDYRDWDKLLLKQKLKESNEYLDSTLELLESANKYAVDLEKENEKMKAVFYELLNLSHHGIDEESWRIRDVLGLKGNI